MDVKEARRQEDIARQDEESRSILESFLAQLIPGSEEFNRLMSEGTALARQTVDPGDQQDLIRQLGSQLVSQQQARVAAGGPATATEARTNLSFQGLRDVAGFSPEEQAILNALRGTPSTGEGGSAGDIFSDLVRRATSPDQYYQSTYGPQLKLLEEQVKARAASRGILGSGLELENLGRTGLDLAMREGQAKEGFRRGALGDFFNLFNVGQGLRERQIGLEEALVNLQSGRESHLTDLLAASTTRRGDDFSNLLQRRTSRAEGLSDVAAQQEAERNAMIGRALGTAAGIGATFIPGIGPVAGPAILGATNAAFSGGASGQLAAQQAQPTSPNLSGSLSRQSQPISLEAILRMLQQAGVS